MELNVPNPTLESDHIQNWDLLTEFVLTGQPDQGLIAMQLVSKAIQWLNLPRAHLDRLKVAIPNTINNAFSRDPQAHPLSIRVLVSKKATRVGGEDQAEGLSADTTVIAEMEKQQLGWYAPRGWNFFIIEKPSHHVQTSEENTNASAQQVIELFLYLEG